MRNKKEACTQASFVTGFDENPQTNVRNVSRSLRKDNNKKRNSNMELWEIISTILGSNVAVAAVLKDTTTISLQVLFHILLFQSVEGWRSCWNAGPR